MRKYDSLYGRLLSHSVLLEGLKQIKRNKGAAGIDGQSLSMFEQHLDRETVSLLIELQEKRYQPRPVKRVTIPKEGGVNVYWVFQRFEIEWYNKHYATY